MSIRCSRPGCGATAAARVLFDSTSATVYLDTRLTEWGSVGVLCDRHAERLTVPRGWSLVDRRNATPRLFPVSILENVSPVGRRVGDAVSRAKRLLTPVAAVATPLSDDGGPSYELPEPYERTSIAIHPSQGEFELPDHRTPLLARAFEAAGNRVRPTSTLSSLIPRADSTAHLAAESPADPADGVAAG